MRRRPHARSRAARRTAAALLVAALASLASVGASFAQARRGGPKTGLDLAREGDCVGALPLLERAEAAEHRPSTAAALARCHVALGELLLAHEIWSSLAREEASPSWTGDDRRAHAEASQQAGLLLERIPTLELEIAPPEAEPRVYVGRRLVDPHVVVLVPPDERVRLRVEADGYEAFSTELLLSEGGHRRIEVRLRLEGEAAAKAPDGEPAPQVDAPSAVWLGARYRGIVLPSFLMGIVGEGGTTAYLPGGSLTLTLPVSSRLDFTGSLGAQSYAAGPFPFKPRGAPDTEWEIVESDLLSLVVTAELMWRFPLDDAERVALRLGGGVGVGFAVFGDLVRTQAYPAGGDPSNPDSYAPCKGPNDPPGSFRYCNQLDKDADRYGKPDRAWGDGGARPVVYPWVAVPQVGLEWRPTPQLALELEVGASITGFLGGAGVRLAL